MMGLIGFLGAICLGLCAVPEVLRTIKDKKCYLGNGFLYLWLGGEILLFIYVLPKGDVPLLLNYGFNLSLLAILCYYKWRKQ
ncbi:MAG: hypothetical protein BWY21_02212 [Parcubacteria group bacterium ADurb.Bin216]|nr:MAG: hypothetical protein BWY21_02212 [Parcubacteria group bacterium ADurb.Bin216]